MPRDLTEFGFLTRREGGNLEYEPLPMTMVRKGLAEPSAALLRGAKQYIQGGVKAAKGWFAQMARRLKDTKKWPKSFKDLVRLLDQDPAVKNPKKLATWISQRIAQTEDVDWSEVMLRLAEEAEEVMPYLHEGGWDARSDLGAKYTYLKQKTAYRAKQVPKITPQGHDTLAKHLSHAEKIVLSVSSAVNPKYRKKSLEDYNIEVSDDVWRKTYDSLIKKGLMKKAGKGASVTKDGEAVAAIIGGAYSDAYFHKFKGRDWKTPHVVESAMFPSVRVLTEETKLTKKDKQIISAFLDHKSADSKKLTTDGQRLDGNWIGGSGIAVWKSGKVHFNDLGSKAAQTVQRQVKKQAPARWLAEDVFVEATAKAQPKIAVKHWLEQLKHNLIAQDRADNQRAAKRGGYVNPYQLAHFMKALDEVRKRVSRDLNDTTSAGIAKLREALAKQFTRYGKVTDPKDFVIGGVRKLVREMDKFEKTGKAPKMAIAYAKAMVVEDVLDESATVFRGSKSALPEGLYEAKSGPADKVAAEELELLISNDASLYRRQYLPILKNLINKKAAGKYDRDKAVTLFMYLVDAKANKRIHNKNTRLMVATSLRDDFENEAELGNYDDLLFKKYQKKATKKRGVVEGEDYMGFMNEAVGEFGLDDFGVSGGARLDEKVMVKASHPGILEVPPGERVEDMPVAHFVKLASEKGCKAISNALVNLVRWNKKQNPNLSKWAAQMQDRFMAACRKKGLTETISPGMGAFMKIGSGFIERPAQLVGFNKWEETAEEQKALNLHPRVGVDAIEKPAQTLEDLLKAEAMGPSPGEKYETPCEVARKKIWHSKEFGPGSKKGIALRKRVAGRKKFTPPECKEEGTLPGASILREREAITASVLREGSRGEVRTQRKAAALRKRGKESEAKEAERRSYKRAPDVEDPLLVSKRKRTDLMRAKEHEKETLRREGHMVKDRMCWGKPCRW